MQPSWRTLEGTVRSIASIKWKVPATAMHLAGIDFDAVLEPSSDERILIEVSVRDDLQKVREDIIKINAYRMQCLADGVMVRGYIIFADEPTHSMVETGTFNKVKVQSASTFFNDFFQYDAYITLRRRQPFGSALNPFTGEPDTATYVPVRYQVEDLSEEADVDQIVRSLSQGTKAILVGDYGTGKSRCVQRVFDILTDKGRVPGVQVFAINLREHWGASSASEIIAGHLEELGLSGSIDNAMQIIAAGGAILLLDGVDEVGAQVFGSTRENRRSIRRTALEGVRKLIRLNRGGVLLTSRSHYFDSDEEMLDSTGLSNVTASHLFRCPEEFTDSESTQYLVQLGIATTPPSWLPRKPLVFQVLATLERSLAERLLDDNEGEFAFWSRFLTAICEREARIHGSLQADAVRQILIALADQTREGDAFLGRLSVRSVREAYEAAIHDSPDEAGEQMLMRLCTLGRVAPASPERQFVDGYVVDGLRAEAFIHAIDAQDRTISRRVWRQPLGRLGWYLLLDSLIKHDKQGAYKATLAMLNRGDNHQGHAEVLSTLLATDGSTIDSGGVALKDCDIYWLRVGQRRLLNAELVSSYVRNMEILPEQATAQSVLRMEDCQIMELYGVSSERGLPSWITSSDVEHYDSLSNANRIKNSDLSPAHTLFISVIHRIFFQPGDGREEKALTKGGFGQQYDPKLLQKILHVLLREKIIGKFPGDDGPVYTPIRKHSRRMAGIKSQLALCGDPLWDEIGALH